MSRRKRVDTSRVAGGFVALPWSVLDSQAYIRLSHPAKSLLLELARQYVRDNNGKLLASLKRLRQRGWTSADVLTRAKRELIEAGLVFETCKGHRPNRASWYALTWFSLDLHDGFDPGAARAFERGAYLKNAQLIPSRGIEKVGIAPGDGIERSGVAPSHGAMKAVSDGSPIPSDGNHLDKPSAGDSNPEGGHQGGGQRPGYGQWVTGYLARLAAHGPQFLAAAPVALPAGDGTLGHIRKNRQRRAWLSPNLIRQSSTMDRGCMRLEASHAR